MILVFDFDGTICDSLDVTLHIANKYFRFLGIPRLTRTSVQQTGLEALLLQHHIPKLLLLAYIPLHRLEMSYHIPNLHLFPHLHSLIPQLAHHHQLHIISSNSTQLIQNFLKLHQLASHFSSIATVSPFSKHHRLSRLQPDFFISDETSDVVAARRANVKSVAVTWGYESAAVLARAHPSHLIHSPPDLLGLFQPVA